MCPKCPMLDPPLLVLSTLLITESEKSQPQLHPTVHDFIITVTRLQQRGAIKEISGYLWCNICEKDLYIHYYSACIVY